MATVLPARSATDLISGRDITSATNASDALGSGNVAVRGDRCAIVGLAVHGVQFGPRGRAGCQLLRRHCCRDHLVLNGTCLVPASPAFADGSAAGAALIVDLAERGEARCCRPGGLFGWLLDRTRMTTSDWRD